MSFGSKFTEKDDISCHDRTTASHLFLKTISTKLQDPSRGEKTGWAKYLYFSTFISKKAGRAAFAGLVSKGLMLSLVGIFLFAPLYKAAAFGPSDILKWFFTPASASEIKVESQNSQSNDGFLDSKGNPNPAQVNAGVSMDDKAFSADIGPSGTIADIQSSDRQGDVSIYVVRDGDTVASVADMFDLSVNTILSANDLEKGATLHAGQTLVILPIDGMQYVAKKGDTVQGIAKKFGANVSDILSFNDLTADHILSVGDIIIIPGGKVSTSSSTPVATSPVVGASAKNPVYKGYYVHPVPAGHKTQGLHGRNAIDYGATVGTPVYASASGTVIVSNFRTLSDPWFGGYGNYIMIQHPNGTKTLYAHLSAVYVAVGAHVDQGMQIGDVGNTGHVIPAPTASNPNAGSHLHFEVRGAKNPGVDGSWKK